ncbi:MAG: TolC family protein [Bacteroidota bacterium]|nr:TolC family protein [Bacteroidota bacterium]
MRIVFHVAVLLMFLSLLYGQESNSVQPEDTASVHISLDSLIAIALQHNPEISMAQYDALAASTRISVARQLPDPQLKIAAMNVPSNFTLTSEGMTMAPQVSLMQMFPWFGKLSAAGDVQKYAYKASTYRVSSTALGVVTNVKKVYGEMYRVQKTIDYLQYKRQLLQSVVKVSEQLFAVGQVPQQDVFRATAELTMTESDIVKMNGMSADLNAQLGALVGRNAPLGVGVDTLPLLSLPSLDSLEALLEQHNPDLKQIHNIELAAQAKKIFAKKDAIPDVNVGVSYGYRGALMPDGTKALNMMNFEVGLSLPVFFGAKQEKMIEEAEAMEGAAQAQYGTATLGLYSRLRSMYADASAQEELIPLYSKELIPQYEATYNSSLSSYSVGKTTFAMLIDNLTALINTKIELVNIESAYFSVSAEIAKLIGESAEQYRAGK